MVNDNLLIGNGQSTILAHYGLLLKFKTVCTTEDALWFLFVFQ